MTTVPYYKKKPHYEGTHLGKRVKVWRTRSEVICRVYNPDNLQQFQEWGMPKLPNDIAAEQAALQTDTYDSGR